MKKTYSALMQELEELKEDYLDENNDEERDLIISEMKAVINQLEISRDEYKNISTSELKQKLDNASTYEEFSNLKNIIKEKREYESNSARIDNLVANGVDFEEDNKKIAKPMFRKFKKVLLGISLLAVGFGATNCMLRKNRSNDSYDDKNPSVTTENTVNYPENEGPNGDIPTEDNQSSEYNDYDENSNTSGVNSSNTNSTEEKDNEKSKNNKNKKNNKTIDNNNNNSNNNNNNNNNNNDNNDHNNDNSKKDTSTQKSTTETRTEIQKETTEKPPKVIESEENKPTPAPKDDTPYPGETDIIIDDDKNYPDNNMPIEEDDNDTIYYDKTTEKTGTSSTTESRKETTTEKTTEDMPIEDDEDDVIYYSSSNVLEKGKSLVKRLTM